MDKEYSLSSTLNNMYQDCKVKTKNEFIKFLKCRRINSHICLNYITKKDISFQFTDHVTDTESIVCKECYLNVLEKFKNLNIKVFEKFNGYCDCGDELSMEKKVFCSNHQGKFTNKKEIDKFLSQNFVGKLSTIPIYLKELVEMLNILIIKYGDFIRNNPPVSPLISQASISGSGHPSVVSEFQIGGEGGGNSGMVSDNNRTAESFHIQEEEEVEESISEIDNSIISDKESEDNKKHELINDDNTFLYEIDSVKYPSFKASNVLFLPHNQIVELIDTIITFLNDLVRKTLHLGITLLLGRLFCEVSNVVTKHECFSSNNPEENEKYEDEGKFHQCRCSLIQNLIRYSNVFTDKLLFLKPEGFEAFSNCLYILIKSPEFKAELSFSCLIHFGYYLYTYFQKWYSSNLFFNTKEIEDLPMNFLLSHFLEGINCLLKDTSYWGSDISLAYNILTLLKKIFLYSNSLKLSNNLDYVRKIINCLETLHFSTMFKIKEKEENKSINPNDTGFHDGDYSYTDLYFLQLFSLFTREFDFSNESNTNEILQYIYKKIKENSSKLEYESFSFNVTLQRALSFFMNRAVLYYTINKKKDFNDKIKEIFSMLSKDEKEIEELILFPILKCLHFINGTKTEQWSHYGTHMNFYYIIYYNYFDIWSLCDINMIKFVVSYFSTQKREIPINSLMKLFDPFYIDESFFQNSENVFIYKKDLEFFFKAVKNEEPILDLLLYPYCFFLQKNINFPKDELYEKAVALEGANFSKIFEQRLNNIIVANQNSVDISKIENYLPLYYKPFIYSIEETLNKDFYKTVVDNKIHYSSKRENHVDTMSVFIKGLFHGLQKYLINSNCPLIKSTKLVKFGFISADNSSFLTKNNFFFLIKIYQILGNFEKNDVENEKKLTNVQKLELMLMHIFVIFIRELLQKENIFEYTLPFANNQKFSSQIIQKILLQNITQNEYIMKKSIYYLISKINKAKARQILEKKGKFNVLQTTKENCCLCEEMITKQDCKNYGYIAFLSNTNSNFINHLHKLVSIIKSNSNFQSAKIYDILLEYKKKHSYTNKSINVNLCFHSAHFDCSGGNLLTSNQKCPVCQTNINLFIPVIKESDTNSFNNFEEFFGLFNNLSKKEIIEAYYNKNPKSKNYEDKTAYNSLRYSNKMINVFLLSIIKLIKPNKNISNAKEMLKKSKDIYSIYNKIFFDLILASKANLSLKTFVFLKNFILTLKLLFHRENHMKNFCIKSFLSLMFKLDSFAREDNIIELIESDFLLLSILFEMSCNLLILFDFKDNLNNNLPLIFIKLIPFILVQYYIRDCLINNDNDNIDMIKEKLEINYIKGFFASIDDEKRENFLNYLKEHYIFFYIMIRKIPLLSIEERENSDINDTFLLFDLKKEFEIISSKFENKDIFTFTIEKPTRYEHILLGNLKENFNNIIELYSNQKIKNFNSENMIAKYPFGVSLISTITSLK